MSLAWTLHVLQAQLREREEEVVEARKATKEVILSCLQLV